MYRNKYFISQSYLNNYFTFVIIILNLEPYFDYIFEYFLWWGLIQTVSILSVTLELCLIFTVIFLNTFSMFAPSYYLQQMEK